MKKTVLIVDDSEFVRNYHGYILEQASFDVIKAMDGSDGLEKLYTHACDLILTDINMAGMDGYEFIRRVRGDGVPGTADHYRLYGKPRPGQTQGIPGRGESLPGEAVLAKDDGREPPHDSGAGWRRRVKEVESDAVHHSSSGRQAQSGA